MLLKFAKFTNMIVEADLQTGLTTALPKSFRANKRQTRETSNLCARSPESCAVRRRRSRRPTTTTKSDPTKYGYPPLFSPQPLLSFSFLLSFHYLTREGNPAFPENEGIQIPNGQTSSLNGCKIDASILHVASFRSLVVVAFSFFFFHLAFCFYVFFPTVSLCHVSCTVK